MALPKRGDLNVEEKALLEVISSGEWFATRYCLSLHSLVCFLVQAQTAKVLFLAIGMVGGSYFWWLRRIVMQISWLGLMVFKAGCFPTVSVRFNKVQLVQIQDKEISGEVASSDNEFE